MNLIHREQPGLVKPRQRWLIWLAFALLWTTALVMPVPKAPWEIGGSDIDLKVILAKCLHVSAYAIFAALTGWLRAPTRVRCLLVFFVMAHGTVTEIVQLWVSTRSGSLLDVGLDNVGIGLGLWLSWKWWSASDRLDGYPRATTAGP